MSAADDRIKGLLDYMEKHELAELEIEEQGFRVRLVKSHPQPVVHATTVTTAAPPSPSPAALSSAGAAPAKPERAPLPAGAKEMTSPIVGTFYRAPKPDADPFVEIGSHVEPDTTVCIIEAMKVMNEVKAEMKGVVRAILVENGQPVEYGQPIFVIEPLS